MDGENQKPVHDNGLNSSPVDAFLPPDPSSPTPEPEKALQRANKRLRQRAVTLPGKMSRADLVKIKRTNAAALSAYPGVKFPAMPKTFGECLERFGQDKPCPYARCRHHLAVDVRQGADGTAAVKVNFPQADTALDIPETCSLRAAHFSPEGQTLDSVASKLNITRERARQIEAVALLKMRGGMALHHPTDYDDHWDDAEVADCADADELAEALEVASVLDHAIPGAGDLL